MQLSPLDWALAFLFVLILTLSAILLARLAGSSAAEFLTSGHVALWPVCDASLWRRSSAVGKEAPL